MDDNHDASSPQQPSSLSRPTDGNDLTGPLDMDPGGRDGLLPIPSQVHHEEGRSRMAHSDDNEDPVVIPTSNGTGKSSWLEVSGACGDFGTLFPLLVALARQRKVYLAPTFLLTGLGHIVTGWYFNIPMPLQPMHLISAQALADALESPTQVAAAGVGMGIAFLLLQFGGIEWFHRWIPKCVMGGLQLGVGWKVVMKGMAMIQNELPWWGQLDCIPMAMAVSALTLYGLKPSSPTQGTIHPSNDSVWQRLWKEPPVGLYLFGLGLLLATMQLLVWNEGNDDNKTDLLLHPQALLKNPLKHVTWNDWNVGIGSGTLPQLPLTTLNSCLSVCLLAETLFPQRGNVVSRKSVCWSIGLMNAIGCPLGMFPHCHGAGALAGQVRLGASSGVSMMGLGVFKILLSLWAAQGSLLLVLDALPVSVLSVLLALSGHELAMTGIKAVLAGKGRQPQDSRLPEQAPGTTSHVPSIQQQDIGVALITAVVIVGTGMAHVGALCGWITYVIHGNGMEELFGRRMGQLGRTNNANYHSIDGERVIYSRLTTSSTHG